MILRLCASNAAIVCDEKRVRPDNSEVMQLICDASLTRDLTGWQPQVSLEEGLTRVVAFIREHPQLYKPSLYNV
jgi:dTDP-glucose 4,6-dehydratase